MNNKTEEIGVNSLRCFNIFLRSIKEYKNKEFYIIFQMIQEFNENSLQILNEVGRIFTLMLPFYNIKNRDQFVLKILHSNQYYRMIKSIQQSEEILNYPQIAYCAIMLILLQKTFGENELNTVLFALKIFECDNKEQLELKCIAIQSITESLNNQNVNNNLVRHQLFNRVLNYYFTGSASLKIEIVYLLLNVIQLNDNNTMDYLLNKGITSLFQQLWEQGLEINEIQEVITMSIINLSVFLQININQFQIGLREFRYELKQHGLINQIQASKIRQGLQNELSLVI